MGKKLYRVKVVLYVMAENESEARVAATNAKFDIFECTAKRADAIDPEWEHAVPYNADDDRTCSEVLASPAQTLEPESPDISVTRLRRPRKWLYANVPYVK